MPCVVLLGSAVLDHRVWVDRWPPATGRTTATAYVEDLGGGAAVAAVTVARLGGTAMFAGPWGGDPAGTRVAAFLESRGVDIRHANVVPNGRTAVSAIAIVPGGERYIIAYPGEGLEDEAYVPPIDAIDRAHAVLVDSRLPRAGIVLAAAARARGVPVVVDFDGSNAAVWALARTATHVIADEDLAVRSGGADALLERLRADGVWGAVTLGSRGVLYQGGGMPAFDVIARDTTGAGDVFHGAFVLALAEGRDPEGALLFASAAAALRCESGEVPDRRAVDRLLVRAR